MATFLTFMLILWVCFSTFSIAEEHEDYLTNFDFRPSKVLKGLYFLPGAIVWGIIFIPIMLLAIVCYELGRTGKYIIKKLDELYFKYTKK